MLPSEPNCRQMAPIPKMKACRVLATGSLNSYAAFFCPVRIFAHLARCAAAIFFREAADIVCFAGEVLVFAALAVGFGPCRAFAHRAFCASAIFRREASEITRAGWPALWGAEPFSDSMTEIAWSSFSTCNSAALRSTRSSCSALVRFDIVAPSFL
jgi:hypothetical protein